MGAVRLVRRTHAERKINQQAGRAALAQRAGFTTRSIGVLLVSRSRRTVFRLPINQSINLVSFVRDKFVPRAASRARPRRSAC